MVLSSSFHEIASNKLEIDVLKFKEEKLYSERLFKKSLLFNKNHKKLFNNFKVPLNADNFLIVYVITIVFLKSNTSIHLSDIKGNVKLSYTSGSVKLLGKQKKQRSKSVLRLISMLIKKSTFVKNQPVSVHLYNVNSQKSLILNKLKHTFFIKLVKLFNQSTYNGCRKKKIRRKKSIKNFK